MIITKDLIPQSKITKETFNFLKLQYKGEKIKDIISLMEKSTGQKFDIDFKNSWDPEVSSKLIDYHLQYIKGEKLDLEEMKNYLYDILKFSPKDRINLDKNNFEDRLWAILLVISDSSRNYFEINDD